MVLFRLLRHLRQYCGYCKTKVNVLNFLVLICCYSRRAAFFGHKKLSKSESVLCLPPKPSGLSPEPRVQGGGLCQAQGAATRAAQLNG